MKTMPRGVGKQVAGALYVHRSALRHLPSEHRALVDAAAAHVTDRRWNVVKIDLDDGRAVSLLDYEEFPESAFPALRESHRVELATGATTVRRYLTNTPILHRKELLLSPDDPERERYAALTQELERRGLFVDMSRRGRKEAWEAALTEAGIHVRGHHVLDTADDARDTRL
jgi:DNA phosphorothioation-associated putative methyltransferase